MSRFSLLTVRFKIFIMLHLSLKAFCSFPGFMGRWIISLELRCNAYPDEFLCTHRGEQILGCKRMAMQQPPDRSLVGMHLSWHICCCNRIFFKNPTVSFTAQVKKQVLFLLYARIPQICQERLIFELGKRNIVCVCVNLCTHRKGKDEKSYMICFIFLLL